MKSQREKGENIIYKVITSLKSKISFSGYTVDLINCVGM